MAAFGESLRGKIRRLETRSDGLDDPGSQERQPSQPPDVIWEHPFALRDRRNRCHSTGEQIVSPTASFRDHFEESEIGQFSWCAIALDNQTHFKPRRLICIGKTRVILMRGGACTVQLGQTLDLGNSMVTVLRSQSIVIEALLRLEHRIVRLTAHTRFSGADARPSHLDPLGKAVRDR
jgi:hypothetical protein